MAVIAWYWDLIGSWELMDYSRHGQLASRELRPKAEWVVTVAACPWMTDSHPQMFHNFPESHHQLGSKCSNTQAIFTPQLKLCPADIFCLSSHPPSSHQNLCWDRAWDLREDGSFKIHCSWRRNKGLACGTAWDHIYLRSFQMKTSICTYCISPPNLITFLSCCKSACLSASLLLEPGRNW